MPAPTLGPVLSQPLAVHVVQYQLFLQPVLGPATLTRVPVLHLVLQELGGVLADLEAGLADGLWREEVRGKVVVVAVLAVAGMAAELAVVGGLALVARLVDLQLPAPHELLAAVAAGETLHLAVRGLVLRQVAPLQEGLAAGPAHVVPVLRAWPAHALQQHRAAWPVRLQHLDSLEVLPAGPAGLLGGVLVRGQRHPVHFQLHLHGAGLLLDRPGQGLERG